MCSDLILALAIVVGTALAPETWSDRSYTAARRPRRLVRVARGAPLVRDTAVDVVRRVALGYTTMPSHAWL